MTSLAQPSIAALEAYRAWAPTYDEENVLTTLDEIAVAALTPPLRGLALLDAACGTARRLVFGEAAPRRMAGVDLVFEMILRSRDDPRRRQALSVGDLRALPVASAAFDVAWCRLAVGHVRELDALYRELSRVVRPGGYVIVTDFHPAASRAGHVRSFRDEDGRSLVVEHAIHDAADHDGAAVRNGLTFDVRLDLPIGSQVKRFYEGAGLLARYERDRGLPLLLALRYRR